jgi:hypothetical protein
MSDDAPARPQGSQPLESGGLILSWPDGDGRRTCRSLWRCAGRHTWWQWADRPEEPLEVYPAPELFR